MNKYECFWKNKSTTVEADTSYLAQQKAQVFFKAKKAYEITVMLVELNGKQYIHNTASI
jgi:protein associated with RNAse G/E